MFYVYTPSRKVNTIKISVLCDIINILKQINQIKDVKNIHILHNDNAEKLLTN